MYIFKEKDMLFLDLNCVNDNLKHIEQCIVQNENFDNCLQFAYKLFTVFKFLQIP